MRCYDFLLTCMISLGLFAVGSAYADHHTTDEPAPDLIEMDGEGRIEGAGYKPLDGEHADEAHEEAGHGMRTAEEHAEEAHADAHGEHGHGADRASAVSHWTDHHVFPDTYSDFTEWHLPGLPAIPLFKYEKPADGKYQPLINLHVLMMVIAAVVLLVAFIILYKHGSMVPQGRLTNFLEVMSRFVRDEICIPSMGEHEGRRFAPLMCTFFFFILTMNLMGLIPLFSTATGNFSVTTGLATMVFLTMTIGAIVLKNPLNWFKSFMPHGVPWPVLILITPLEIAGLFIKTFALAVRLFANMMAGHIVLFSFIGLMAVYGWMAAPAMGLALGVYALEVLVAFIQAYVFTVLSSIFIGHIVHPH